MLTDSLLNLVAPATPLSLVLGAGVGAASAVIDTMGNGVGTAPQNIWGNAAVIGADFGIGDNRLLIESLVGTAFATGTAATLNVQFQGAPDTGVGGGYAAGAWQTYSETGQLTAAQLTSGYAIRMDYPAAVLANARPRFIRPFYIVLAATTFTAGTIAAAVMSGSRDDQNNRFMPSNFLVK